MKKRLLFILLMIVVFCFRLQAQETVQQAIDSLTPAQKKEFQEKCLNEFLDVDMLMDVLSARRFNYIDDNNIASSLGNRKLRQTIDYFKAQGRTGVGIFCRVDKQHLWVKLMSAKGYRGNFDTTSSGKFNLLFDIVLVPTSQAGENSLYKPVITYHTGFGSFERFDTLQPYSKIKPAGLQDFKAYMQDSLPLLKRDDIVPKLNDKIVTALLKLMGDEMPPITVNLTPKPEDINVLCYDSVLSANLREYYPDISIHGKTQKGKWISVKKNTPLTIIGDIKKSAISDSTDKKLQLKRESSIVENFTTADSVKTFIVNGLSEGEHELKAVYQVAEGKGTDILAGQVNVAAYSERTLKVVIVPLEGVKVPDEAQLKKELNRIMDKRLPIGK